MALSYRLLLVLLILVSTVALAGPREWQHGTLLDSEQEKVTEGSTTHYTTDGEAKQRRGKTNYSQNTTATTSDNVDTYEVYTIQGPSRTYIAREKLLFPWSKPANVTVGGEIQFAVEGRKLYVMDDDKKEHKASIVKTSMNAAK